MPIARLDRSVIALLGDDVEDFLSGIITNNLTEDITFAALLTPQGKIIADFFVTKVEGGLWLDTPSKFGEALLKRLKMYKLRAKFELKDISEEVSVYAAWGQNENGEGDEGHADPRHSALGLRIITADLEPTASGEDYNAHRLALGIPDSLWDFVTTSVFPADANMDILRGVDYQKGCFVGQEVVSRMHRKTDVRKRMCGISHEGAKVGGSLMLNDKPVGTVLSVQGDKGMAMIRMDRLGAIRDLVSENDVLVLVKDVTHAD